MKDKFSFDNPELIGLATIRIAYLNSDPELKEQGRVITDFVITPDLDCTNLSLSKIQPHVILTHVATEAIREFLDNPESATNENDINSAQ
jgi:hypothetical protein